MAPSRVRTLALRDPWWQVALDVLLPPRCVGCGRRGFEVCDDCLGTIRPLGPNVCPRCSAPSPGGRTCRFCAQHPGQVRAVVAGQAYEGAVRAAILAFKYRGRTRLAPFLAHLLASPLDHRPLTIDLVVPVPLSKRRLQERGFNQAEMLARPLAEAHGWALCADALVRERDTQQQTRLSSGDRWTNVSGAFAASDPALVDGQRILLVDDVCTTGATLEACASPLLRAGAEGVWALVVARDVFGRADGAGD
jgi:ComF family protein